MQYTKKHLGLQFVVFCLVLALAGGCKTMGSRTLDDQEEKPSRAKRAAVIAVAVLGVAAGVFGGVALAKRLRHPDLGKQFDKQLDDFRQLTKKAAENPDDEQATKEVHEVAKRIKATIEEAGSDELARRFEISVTEAPTYIRADYLLKNLQEASTSAARQEAKEAIEELIEELNKDLDKLRAGGGKFDIDIDYLVEEIVRSDLPDPRKTYDKLEDYVAAHKNATGAKPEAELRELWDNYDSVFATRVEEFRKNSRNNAIDAFEERLLKKLRQAVQ